MTVVEATEADGKRNRTGRFGVPPAILVIAPQPFLADRGTPIAIAQVVESLVRLGYRVDVLTYPLGRDFDLEGVRILRVPRVPGIRTVPIGFSFRKVALDLAMLAPARRLIRSGRYAAVHAVEEGAILAVLGRGRRRVPIVYDMQSSLPEQLAARWPFRMRAARAVARRVERWLLEASDGVVCSAGLATRVRGIAPSARVHEWWFPAPAGGGASRKGHRLREELRIPAGSEVVVYAGNFARYQGLEALVAAIPIVARSRPSSHFVLVGGEPTEVERLRRCAAEAGVADRTTVLERRPRDRIGAFLDMADVLVAPRSAGANLPLKLFEYGATGKPVVASGEAALAWSDAPDSVVRVPHSVDALAAALIQALENAPDRPTATPTAPAAATDLARFDRLVAAVHAGASGRRSGTGASRLPRRPTRVSVVIPARNEAGSISDAIGAVAAQEVPDVEVEIVVVDDGSEDDTADVARAAGARVVESGAAGGMRGGNPGAARNRGAAVSTGDPIVFLDADCTPAEGWLARILAAHDEGATVVGGALEMPDGLSFTARCDYLGSWYNAHPRRPAGPVPNHPPANLSIRREAFLATRGFSEAAPVCDGHEELALQAELVAAGHEIRFEPSAVVVHHHPSGLAGLIGRNYRWAYSSVQSKVESGRGRYGFAYRFPRPLIYGSGLMVVPHAAYIVGCWLKARRLDVIPMLPMLLVGRIAYAVGTAVGGVRWLRTRQDTGRGMSL